MLFGSLPVNQAKIAKSETHLVSLVLAGKRMRQDRGPGRGRRRPGSIIALEIVGEIPESPRVVLSDLEINFRWHFQHQEIVDAVLVELTLIGGAAAKSNVNAVGALADIRLVQQVGLPNTRVVVDHGGNLKRNILG